MKTGMKLYCPYTPTKRFKAKHNQNKITEINGTL